MKLKIVTDGASDLRLVDAATGEVVENVESVQYESEIRLGVIGSDVHHAERKVTCSVHLKDIELELEISDPAVVEAIRKFIRGAGQ